MGSGNGATAPVVPTNDHYTSFIKQERAIADAVAAVEEEEVIADREALSKMLAARMPVSKLATLLCDLAENDDKPDVQLKAVQVIMGLRKLTEGEGGNGAVSFVFEDGTKMKVVADPVKS